MLTFYENNNFKLFKCNLDKSPDLPRKSSWRDPLNHLSIDNVERIMATGGYIGAWLPEDYIIIDIDVKGDKHKHDGIQPFKNLCFKYGIEEDLLQKTLVVRTGSGGYHLYFKLPEDVKYTELSQKSLENGLDIRTHLGYVIASGTNGYSVFNQAEVMELPGPLLNDVRSKAVEKAERFNPEKALPVKELKNVLKKVDIHNYDTNDTWQEMVTAIIATSGNGEEIIETITEWSMGDERYTNDNSIRNRLETFTPDGGITAGTFLYLLKIEGISKYLYTKIRTLIGKEFNFSKTITESFDLPFTVDYTILREDKELMESLYYKKHQVMGANLFARLVNGQLHYVTDEKCFYYFNGNYWVEVQGIQDIIFSVFLRAGLVFFTDFSEGKDDDADELFNDYINFLGPISTIQKFEQAIKQHTLISRKGIPWDAPELQLTLTLQDSVMDFSGDKLVFRSGRKEEYRRLAMSLYQKDFNNPEQPLKFKELLKDIFPNDDTRKTATYALSTMLSGTGKFRKFQIWNGSGNNGKSALMDVMAHVIGKRAISYTPESLLSTNRDTSLTPELAKLQGALVAYSSETNEFKKVSEGAIKRLTGNEVITANPKFKNTVQFHTIWQTILSTNHLPQFSAHDAAFVNRLLILPFYTHFYDNEEMKVKARNKGSRYFKKAGDIESIKNGVKAERASILYYLACRCMELDHVIPESAECLSAKSHYVKDNNGIMEFLQEMVEYSEDAKYFTPTKDLVELYNQEQNTKYSSKFIVSRVKEVFPMVDNHVKRINGKLTRGLTGIRLKYGAYPEGFMGNYTQEEIDICVAEEEADKLTQGGF